MRRLAHRGDWRQAPENSLAALQAALAIPGCDGLEFDVRVSADGVPVLLHDDTLARVQGRPEPVASLRADALDALGIPSLADVLAAIPHHVFLDVELKGIHDRAVVEILASGRGASLRNAVVSSFETATLERIAGLAPTWPRWFDTTVLGPEEIDTAVELGCVGIVASWQSIDARTMADARRAGLDVIAWTVRRRSTFDRLERLGVHAACVEAAALDG